MGSSVPSDLNCSVGNESPARMREPQLVLVLFHWNRGERERGTGSKASGILPLLQALLWFGISKCFIGTRQSACMKFAAQSVRLLVKMLYSC